MSEWDFNQGTPWPGGDYNADWSPRQQVSSSTTNGGSTSGTQQSGQYDPQQGYGYDLLARADAFTRQQADINNAAQLYRQQQHDANALALQNGTQSYQQYQANLDRIQRESEFARTYASNQLAEEHRNAYQMGMLGVSQGDLALRERETSAKLAANPSDLVAYEFYKRMLGTPQGQYQAPSAVPTFGSGTAYNAGTAGTAGATGAGTPGSGATAIGMPAAPPAYSDPTLSTLAGSIFNTQPGQSWNPTEGGQGVFGSTIPSPNGVSRGAYAAMSPTDRAIADSFIQAGVNVGGTRTAIPVDDYKQQMQNSWVPTYQDVAAPVKYG